MKDILLNQAGDIALTREGDITLAASPIQAVIIKLRWMFAEWVFDPEKGIPWYESILVKKPDIAGIKKILIREMLEVEEVLEVQELDIIIDPAARQAVIRFQIRTTEEIYNEEVVIHGGTWGNP